MAKICASALNLSALVASSDLKKSCIHTFKPFIGLLPDLITLINLVESFVL